MKDAKEVLHQKEAELARVRKEVESLNLVVRLLADDDDQGRFADLGKKLASAARLSAAESLLEWPNAMKIAG